MPGERLPLAGQPTVEESPVEDGSHWHNHGKAIYLIGKGMGDGMVEMLKR